MDFDGSHKGTVVDVGESTSYVTLQRDIPCFEDPHGRLSFLAAALFEWKRNESHSLLGQLAPFMPSGRNEDFCYTSVYLSTRDNRKGVLTSRCESTIGVIASAFFWPPLWGSHPKHFLSSGLSVDEFKALLFSLRKGQGMAGALTLTPFSISFTAFCCLPFSFMFPSLGIISLPPVLCEAVVSIRLLR